MEHCKRVTGDPGTSSPRVRRWLILALALVAVGQLFMVVPKAWSVALKISLDGGMTAILTEDQNLYLEAPPLAGEGLISFTRRLTGDARAVNRVLQSNGKKPRRLLAGFRYRLPFEDLLPSLQLGIMTKLFQRGETSSHGWVHEVPEAGHSQSLWKIAEWYSGNGRDFPAIREHNQLSDNTVRPGQRIVVPRAILRQPFASSMPPMVVAIPPDREPGSTPSDNKNTVEQGEQGEQVATAAALQSSTSDLTYISNDQGEFAVYRLRRGEALYSAVVARFTGRTHAEDVNAVAADIARLNAISDVTDMPVGQAVRIPFDLLVPEFLPVGDPRRAEFDKNRTASAKYKNSIRASSLEGITVILDAGHGGDDPGALRGGVWESVYVYDIMMRAKRLLETRTSATVVTTTSDGNGNAIPAKNVLPQRKTHKVLTTPPYRISDPRVGVNLRWYLANSVHRKATKKSGDENKTVFVSIHADSLHSSLRGAMAYLPAASLTKGDYGKSGTVYSSRAEHREQPRVNFSWKDRVKSEGLSRQLAESILEVTRQRGLRVHREKPIRDRIIRCRKCRPFVPAVIRRNAVPAKLLFEVCNLNNTQDRKLLQTQDFRHKMAHILVDGVLRYYGQPAIQVASVEDSRPLSSPMQIAGTIDAASESKLYGEMAKE